MNYGVIKINKYIKKAICLCLSLIMCSLLFACGKNENDNTGTTAIPTVTITFPEGYTILQISEKLEENGVCSANEFRELCKTIPEGYSALLGDIDTSNKIFALEGYIFPDTYEFYVNEGAKNALARFLGNTRSKITVSYFDRAKELGMSMNEVFTLASVIQSECSVSEEMPKVSSVFHNRLANQNNGFPYLGSDVTRHYIEKKMKSYIDENSLDYDSLFAAYCTNDGYDLKTKGLPAGPICNPGISAINAALWPDDDEYLYFFTDNDGAFHYHKTYSEFQRDWNSISK